MRLNVLRIAARQSDLARLQAYRVGDALKEAHPEIRIQYSFRASLGDVNQTDPLWKMPEKGVFTEDFLGDLIDDRADLVVHSWKDLPTEERPETEICATLPRADVRDLLLFRNDRLGSDVNGGRVRILTSSPRRAHNLSGFLRDHLPFEVTDLSFENVRGNIPTRMKKLLSQDVEGLVVAKAALDRLLAAPEAEFGEVRDVIRSVLNQTRFMVLPLSVNPTAAAQGALAVEIKRERPELRELLSRIHDDATFRAVEKERKILASYGGGCHQKIGVNVLPRPYGEWIFLRGLTDRGEHLNRADLLSSTDGDLDEFSQPALFFDREMTPRRNWEWAERERFLWIARETAWPASFSARADAVVWTAGLKTWRKLAERGVWVAGSSEGFGEDEPARLDDLLGESPKWTKLSHDRSTEFSETVQVCATYRLIPRAETPNLRGQSRFYWMSASAFDRARELFPEEIRAGEHASGPGHTHQHLRRILGPEAKLRILAVPKFREKDRS